MLPRRGFLPGRTRVLPNGEPAAPGAGEAGSVFSGWFFLKVDVLSGGWGALGLFAVRNQLLTLIAIKHADLLILFRPFTKIAKAFLRCAENPVFAADIPEDTHEFLGVRTRHVIGISVSFNILPF